MFASALGEPARREAERVRLQHLAAVADARAISAAFAAADIPHRFVHGVSLARYHPDPGLRTLQDLDVWVPEGRVRRAAAALARLGLARADHGDAVFRRTVPAPANVDLLTRVPPLAESLFLPSPEPDPALRLPCLPPAEEMAALLWRALIRNGRFKAVWLLDAALVAGSMNAADWDRFDDLVAAARLAAAFDRFAAEMASLPGAAFPRRPAARGRRRQTPFERQLARLWDRGGLPGLGNVTEALWEKGPAHRKATRLLRLLWPDRDFLDRRYGRRSPRLARRAARPAALAAKGLSRVRKILSRPVS